jgi:hypothetical protein
MTAIGLRRDISERKRAEEEPREAQARLGPSTSSSAPSGDCAAT